ncbi:MAG TPA: glycoside hydrolase family 44 protein, partial [Polyangiales bacterium]|nr:glycoside hydrolase family 44 protein [Polyangiales bacterium]
YTNLQNASDANGRDFLEWYLDQAKAAEAGGGKLIDYLDLHWYPEAKGGNTRITGTETDAAVVTAREQAPRSLWDATYDEDSWIHDSLNGPITLVPRMLKKIADHDPGTKLSFTEWNYGGGGHISGAIASADVLGVFGREGVSLACLWELNSDESFSYAALRAYRNFDGQGGQFGDTSILATTSDVTDVSVYASTQSTAADGVRLVAINKATTGKSVSIKLWHGSTFSHFNVYQLAGTSAAFSKQSDQPSVAKNAWKLTLPAQSVSVLVPVQ